MAIKTKIIDDVGIIKLKGPLMGGDETTNVHENVKHMVSEDIKKIVLDLHGVRWMNSHGIGMLMGCYSTMQNVQGVMVLCRLSEKVENLLDMTKVIKLFDIYEGVREAVKALQT